MPRPVAPWTWRRALRDHGPENATELLTAYTIGTFMDRDGFAYPSQQTIAAGMRASVRTAQRHIASLKRQGWLDIVLAGRGGQGWRHHAYRAAVPDRVPLDELDEKLSDIAIAQSGDVGEGGDIAVSSPSRERDDNGCSNVATNGAERGDTRDANVATQLCRTNSRSETPALRTLAKREAQSDDRALLLAKGGDGKRGRRTPPFPKTQPTQEGLRGRAIKEALRKPLGGWVLSDVELGERVEKLWHADVEPELIVATLLKYADAERIRRVLSHRFNVPWVSV